MSEQRLVDLEIKFSHQDSVLEELQETVHAQYLMIEKLQKQLKIVTDRLKESDMSLKTPHEKPPHY